MKIGFIGLGTMGIGMALNLQKAGHDMVVHDLRKESAEPLLAADAAWADSVAELGAQVDAVFTSLPGPKEMQALALGEAGLLATLKPGSIWFDLTTNSPAVVKNVAERCAAQGITLLDAPVSGGPAGARSGKLAIYVGGDRAVFDAHRKMLDAIGDRVMHVGAVGAGNTTKLVHNFVSMTVRMALVEGFTVGVKAGLDPMELWHAVRQGVIGRSRTFDLLGEEYLTATYEPPKFALRLSVKDFTLALEMARDLDVPLKLAESAYEDYTAAMERGWGDRDSRAPMALQNERAGVTVKATREAVQQTLARG